MKTTESRAHTLLQPSSGTSFMSSQVSSPSTTPSPHTGVWVVVPLVMSSPVLLDSPDSLVDVSPEVVVVVVPVLHGSCAAVDDPVVSSGASSPPPSAPIEQ
jgi:hypothetical protein